MRWRTRLLNAGAVLLFLLAASCSTVSPAGETKQPDELWIEQIQTKIEEDRLAEAYQDVSLLERDGSRDVPTGKIRELKDSIENRLRSEFLEKVEAREYEQALRLYWALKGVGKEGELGDWSVAALFTKMAESRNEAGDTPLAFLYALRARSAGLPASWAIRRCSSRFGPPCRNRGSRSRNLRS
jgi:hypothetical protein